MTEDTARSSLEKIWDGIPLVLKDWTVTIFIGFLTVTHWRSLWTLFDIWLCDRPADATLAAGTNFCFTVPAMEDETYRNKRFHSAVITYFLGVGLLVVSVVLMWGQVWYTDTRKVTPVRGVVRFLVMYMLGVSCNCIWRGIWYFTDHWILPNNPIGSYYLTSFVGAAGAFAICAGNSLLAPPAIFLLDGPSMEPPPVAVTMLSTYYDLTLPADSNKPPRLPLSVYILDIAVSFFGTWLILDDWFWGFTDSDTDVAWSILWSAILALICVVLASEAIVARVDRLLFLEQNVRLSFIVGRIRTFILAWGAVAFWRAIWTMWDLWLGKSSNGSAYGGEFASIAVMTLLGCLSCITAPPSTLGLDVKPDPESVDEPLFAMLPLPWNLLYLVAIARSPPPAPEKKGGEIELAAGATEQDSKEEEEVGPAVSTSITGSLQSSVERLANRSYCEMQRPNLSHREKSLNGSLQRPGLETERSRSSFFRNR